MLVLSFMVGEAGLRSLRWDGNLVKPWLSPDLGNDSETLSTLCRAPLSLLPQQPCR